ncbi:actin filament-associated protein 1-like 2 isoform X2 [Pelodiscus sinensis]|uniref:actin filament-associated protein 1-like 2 isoform X2 n=1 Tax=Pelodiscus sinensis TaxID=13735 RepID=UPI003F6D1594
MSSSLIPSPDESSRRWPALLLESGVQAGSHGDGGKQLPWEWDLDTLLSDLEAFLLILDRESLSSLAQAKKKSLAELLARLQRPPSEDAEYMIMRCIPPSSGSSAVPTPTGRSPRQGERRPGEEAGEEREVVLDVRPGPALGDGAGERSDSRAAMSSPEPPGRGEWDPPTANGQCSPGGTKPLGTLPSLPAEDSYEEAEPISPGGHVSPAGGGDTDSSHYESYGEDDDCVKDRAHYIQWPPAAEAPARPEAQLCGFLWRKRWLGQWAKQLFIIREHALLCYKCAKDLQPVLELDLRGCRVAYKAKRGKKMQHVLKITGAASEGLVMGFQSRQQAEDWRKVMEEVSSSPLSRLSAPSSPAAASSDQGRDSHQGIGSQPGSDSEEENSPGSPAAAGCLPSGEPTKGGFLDVQRNGQWQKLWCRVDQGAVRMFRDPGCTESPEYAVPLAGSDVSPGADAGQRRHIYLSQQGREVVVLQTHSDDERDVWLKILQREKGAESTSTYETSVLGEAPNSAPVGALLLRRFPTPNAYMDDPFGQLPPATHPSPIYSNADLLRQLQRLDKASQDQPQRLLSALPGRAPEETATPPASPGKAPSEQRVQVAPELRNRDFFQSQRTLTPPERKAAPDSLDFFIGKRAFPKLEETVGQLERACRVKARLKAGSEMNLLDIGRSLKGHIATATSSEASFLTPLLKRTTSTKSALRRVPSVVVIEKGKVLQKRKEWELKSAM